MNDLEKKVNALILLATAEDKEERRKAREALLGILSATPAAKTQDAETVVREILLELGAHDHQVGHQYLVQAILLAVKDQMYINNITFGLYPQLAAHFNTTASRIERGIRHNIETAWTRGDLEVLDKYFGNTVDPNKGKPTNSEFIVRIANVVKLQMKNAA